MRREDDQPLSAAGLRELHSNSLRQSLRFPIKKMKTANAVFIFSVGARGFEPPTSPTRTVRASRAAPRPERFCRRRQQVPTPRVKHGDYIPAPQDLQALELLSTKKQPQFTRRINFLPPYLTRKTHPSRIAKRLGLFQCTPR